MQDVFVVGTGIIPFGKYPDKTLADLGWPAVKQAMKECGVNSTQIGAVYCGTALGGMLAGQRVMKMVGPTGMPIINIENACSSSSSALSQGWMAIASGVHDLVVVIGVLQIKAGLMTTGRIADILCRYMDDMYRIKKPIDTVIVNLHVAAIARAARAEDDDVKLGEVVARQLAALVAHRIADASR